MMRRKEDTNTRVRNILESQLQTELQAVTEEEHKNEMRLRSLYRSNVQNTKTFESNSSARLYHNNRQESFPSSYSIMESKESSDFRQSQMRSRPVLGSQQPRIEALALQQDLHNPLNRSKLPINEWVPPLGYVGGNGYSSAPRNWPKECEDPSTLKNSSQKNTSYYQPKPSFARETTVTRSALQSALFPDSNTVGGSLTEYEKQQQALMFSGMMRSTQRIIQREAQSHAALLTDALEERKDIQLKHADWLASSNNNNYNYMKKDDKVSKRESRNRIGRKQASYGAQQSSAMGVLAAPDTVYRSQIRKAGSGLRKSQTSKQTPLTKVGQISAYIKPSHNDRYIGGSGDGGSLCNHDPDLERSIAKKQKARRLRFVTRLSCVASFLQRLHQSFGARPGNLDLIHLHEQLKRCGSENSDPLLISRGQFIQVCKHVFSEVCNGPQNEKLINDLFSCFDIGYGDRVRFDSLIAALMLANRPDVYKLIGFLGDSHNSSFSSLLPVFKAVFELYGSKATALSDNEDNEEEEDELNSRYHTKSKHEKASYKVSADDCREMFLLASLNEDDYLTMDSLWSTTAVEIFSLKPRSRHLQLTWDTFIEALHKQNGTPLLIEYQRQVAEYQQQVKLLIDKNKHKP